MTEPQTPQRQRSWIETVVVFVLWGTDGLERGKTIPQFGLNTMLLLVSVFCIWVAQDKLCRVADAKVEARIEAAQRGVRTELPSNWSRQPRIMSGFNLVAVFVGACCYRRRGFRGLWFAVAAAVLGTFLSLAMDAVLPPGWL